jgi:hypothetical protein
MTSSESLETRDPWMWIVVFLGVTTFANALWMLAGPMHWYTELPAAVPDTGPFNPHFVRDIGCAFLTTGVALVWAFFSPRFRLPLITISAVFLAAHAILHAYDTLRGALGHDHWMLDLPGVYLPGLLLPFIAFRLAREDRARNS